MSSIQHLSRNRKSRRRNDLPSDALYRPGSKWDGRSEQERFDDKWMPEPNTGCWLWLANLGEGGYGQAKWRGKTRRAHRISWEIRRGPIPGGMVLDHLCRTRSCVNPDHLRVVTATTNALENSDSRAAKNAIKEKCPRCGSDYYTHRRGRYCRNCANASQRIRRANAKVQ